MPLLRGFDYLPPAGWDGTPILPGTRVQVPFGRRQVVGCILGPSDGQAVPAERLRPIQRVLDRQPLLSPADLNLLHWAAAYYHHPQGEVLSQAFPVLLRRARSAEEIVRRYSLTEAGRIQPPEQLERAPRQQQLLAWLQTQPDDEVDVEQLDGLDWDWRAAMRALESKGWVLTRELMDSGMAALWQPSAGVLRQTGPELNGEQATAVESVSAALGGFQAFLLEGVTGSGKTEVYLRLIQQVLEQGRQALVLLPEIALTPQLEARFRERFSVPVGVLHSGLSDGQRLRVWLAAQRGSLPLLAGTRSAVFTPLPKLGLIVVDEEHDVSFKQQEGFRLHARDVAVKRARMAGVPIVLGSATPSLESSHNADRGRYQRLPLSRRAGKALPPLLRLVDSRNQPLDAGLSPALQAAVAAALDQGEQALLFLNRRGYAPVLLCHACGWVGRCRRCDANCVVHVGERRLRCHLCGANQPLPQRCPDCQSDDLRYLGQGTERVEQTLQRLYPGVPLVRVDRDSVRRKGELERILEDVHSGRARLLLGTQMLAKGHHFPNVTLVGVLDVDGGLYSVDFRAGERLAQLIVQVAGRAGRGDQPGTVLLQTLHPEHPLLQALLREGYQGYVRGALQERQAAGLPPFSFQALLRADSAVHDAAQAFLAHLAEWIGQERGIRVLGPAPAPRGRVSGRYRWQLLLQSPRREALHLLLNELVDYIDTLSTAGRLRWSLDVDPVDLY
jgi:primosomal protein N' (replication factor Y)